MGTIISVFSLFCQIIIYMLLGRAILSWFVNPYNANPNSFMYKLYAFITQVTEPIVRPARNFMSRFNTGRVDLSILVAMLAVMAIRFIVVTIFKIIM